MKKLLIFLMIAIPLLIVLIVNFTVNIVVGDVYIAVERIELDKSSIVANVDERASLKATIYPQDATNKDIVWSSDNEEVAVVDENGNISFVGFGNGYITATTADGNKRANCYFYVTDTKVHQVILTAPSNEMNEGQTMQLNATILPSEAINKNIIFSSSDERIAKVDSNGLVYALSSGNVTITATSEDGGFVDFVNISITIPISGITVGESDVVISRMYYQISYSIYPQNATNKDLKFEIDDSSIASVDQYGLVNFKKAGTVNVTISTLSGQFAQSVKVTSTDGYAYQLDVTSTIARLQVGQSEVINYTIIPSEIYNTSINIQSENEEIAYVDESGYIHAVRGGNTIINVSIEKAPGSSIVKQIYVYVTSPATSILIDDIITADSTVVLEPISYPQDSTNTSYFYHSENSNVATVDSYGRVTFLSQEPREATILIYANEDYSDVYKRVTILYTAGFASSVELLDENLTLEYGQVASLNYKLEPINATKTDFKVEIVSSSIEGEVVQVQSDGSLLAVGGGECVVKVSLPLYDGNVWEGYCNISVTRQPSSVEIDLDLEMLDGQYVTGQSTVPLNGYVLPEDATIKEIVWSVNDKNIGIITNNTLIFNQAGEIMLYATCGEKTSQVSIRYTGLYPISAEIGVMSSGEIIDLPISLTVGDSYEVVLKSFFPSNASNTNISLQVTNQITLAATGEVLQLNGNTITAVNGGSATLIAYVGSSLSLSFQIDVTRLPQSISVLQSNIKTTEDEVNLDITVSPLDTTNKDVKITVDNQDIATVQGTKLIFSQNGKVTITVTSVADEDIFTQFTVEKIEKEAILLSIHDEETFLVVDDLAYFDLEGITVEYDSYNIEIIKQNPLDGQSQVLIRQNDMLKAQALGSCEIELQIIKDDEIIERYSHLVQVIQYVEDIELVSDIDYYNDEYITALEVLNLEVEVYPSNANLTEVDYKITQSYSSQGISEAIAYINDGKLYFLKEGYLILTVTSLDEGAFSKNFRIRYTGGNAISAEINITSPVYMNIGDSITVEVTSWLPKDVVNDLVLIRELTHTANVQVVEIEGNKITAVNGGISRILIELSNGITKDITINVIKAVTSIEVSQDNILTIDKEVTVNAVALPSSATNRVLSYQLEDTEIAYVEQNTVIFTKPGTVKLIISSTDGGGAYKEVIVTSTFGYISSLQLNTTQKSINKNDTFKIYLLSYLPADAKYTDIHYEILSQTANDGGENAVVKLDEDGNITGLYGGNAIIRVYTYDYYGNKIYTDCNITVISAVTSVDITFNQPLDLYQNQNSYITSLNEISFNEICYPLDSTIDTFHYTISDTEIAEIENGKIIFKKKGQVVIKFISDDSSKGEKSKSITFYYTAGDLVSVDIDRTQMSNNTIYLNAGAEFEFIANSFMPSDCDKLIFSYQNITENRNDQDKAIGIFEDNKFIAQNGGSITFNLEINRVSVGQFTIIVTRYAEYIEVEGESDIIISLPSYTIKALAMPSDTSQRELAYSSSDSTLASVGINGEVEFYGYGRVTITITLKENSAIKTTVNITYTKQVQSIHFNDTRVEMYTGDYVDIFIASNPIDADAFELELTVSDPSIAELTTIENGWRLIGKKDGKGGEVTVTAKVLGSEIVATKTFTFYKKLSDIQLELDKVDDVAGLGQYRVFGKNFLDASNKEISTYQMKYSIQPSNEYSNLLEWSSSDEEIATVDQNGMITVHSSGKVRITVKQIAPFEGAAVTSDYYDFTFVDGVNVYSYSEYMAADSIQTVKNKGLTDNYSGIVLQNDIICDKSINKSTIYIDYNIYGNGHMIDLSNVESYERMVIRKSNIIIDNVTLRGNTLSANSSLMDLENKGIVLALYGHATNVLLYNSIVENADTCINIYSSSAIIKGCIVRNALLACVKLSRLANDPIVPKLTVEDSAFANTLLCGIMFNIDNSSDVGQRRGELTLVGDVYFYMWHTADEIEQGMKSNLEQVLSSAGFSSVLDEVVRQFKEVVRKYSDYKYTYNGTDYYNFSVLNFDISIVGLSFKSGNGIINRSGLNGNCNYTDINIKGTITAGVANAQFSIPVLTLAASSPFIRPSDTYEGNQFVLAKLRQPSLF